jgi:acetyltransferase-like isoleucine patch superfamily enzyme
MKVPQFILENSKGTVSSPDKRVVKGSLFANYDMRIEAKNELGFVKEFHVGRGSFGVFERIRSHSLDQNVSPILKVGSMSVFAVDSMLIIDGEHANDQVINYDFSQFPATRAQLRNNKQFINPLRTKGVMVIGSNVVISRKAVILPGVKIGNGAVVGAAAVVTRDVPPFSIVAGNPAKVIKYRFDEKTIERLEEIRWWDFEYNYLFSNLYEIQQLSTERFVDKLGDLSKNVYHTSEDRFVFANGGPMTKCIGCDLDGRFVPYGYLPETIRYYIDQAQMPENTTIHMVRNILDYRE